MKATGIIRRIDDLGRIFIPKEIRRNLHIVENDPFELYIVDDMVCFKKYHPETNILKNIEEVQASLTNYNLTLEQIAAISNKLNEAKDLIYKEFNGV